MIETLAGNAAIMALLVVGWIDIKSKLQAMEIEAKAKHEENLRRFERLEAWADSKKG